MTVVEFDDFYPRSPSGRPESAEATRNSARASTGDGYVEQVLRPLSADRPAKYQRYDWPSDALAEWHSVAVGGIVVVEGNYSTRRELFGFYDYTLWIDAPRKLRLERGVRRGGEDTRARWLDEWMPEEDRYIAAEAPAERVDQVLDGSDLPPAPTLG